MQKTMTGARSARKEKVELHQTVSAQLTSDIELIKRAVYNP